MTGEKEIHYWMQKINDLERRNITLNNQVLSLKSIVEHDLLMVERLQAENRRLATILSGNAVKIEIDAMLAEINCG